MTLILRHAQQVMYNADTTYTCSHINAHNKATFNRHLLNSRQTGYIADLTTVPVPIIQVKQKCNLLLNVYE